MPSAHPSTPTNDRSQDAAPSPTPAQDAREVRAGEPALRAKNASTHPRVRLALQALGEQLRRARVARDLTLDDLSARMGVGRQTLARMEAGAPGVSLEALGLALWNMNLLDHLAHVAAPGNDPEGQRLADLRAPSRARGKRLRSPGWDVLRRL